MMNKEEGMSMREVDRLEVIREVLGRRLRQGEASERLGSACGRRSGWCGGTGKRGRGG